jgi:hypothetical protein
MGKDRHGNLHIDVEPHLTGQAGEVKDIDADAQAVLYTILKALMCLRRALSGHFKANKLNSALVAGTMREPEESAW